MAKDRQTDRDNRRTSSSLETPFYFVEQITYNDLETDIHKQQLKLGDYYW